MVGFDPKAQRHLSKSESALAGSISGFVTRGLLQPLDVLKIRFQLQVEPIKHNRLGSKYGGLYHAVKQIFKEEGLSALWKGHVPAQGLSIFYGLVQFSTFESLTHLCWEAAPKTWTENRRPLVHTVCGALAGSAATVVVQPLDILRTRLVAQGEPKIYKGSIDAVIKIYSQEGVLAFYKGIVPTMVAIAPYIGAQFGFYRLFQETFDRLITINDYGVSRNFVAGAMAGVSAKVLTYPLDLVKKRLQVQGFEEARKAFGQIRIYSGMRHCIHVVFTEEGSKGLFKGLYPSLLKAAFSTSFHMTAYEIACQVFLYYNFFENS